MSAPPRVLFVCLGNICRSPLAACVVRDLAAASGAPCIEIDSCGTGGWHVGGPADPRSVAVALRHGHRMTHRARQLDPSRDFDRFDLLLAMDRSNRDDLIDARPARSSIARVELFRSFDPALRDAPEHALDIPDPYSGSEDGFERVYGMIRSAGEGLLLSLARARS